MTLQHYNKAENNLYAVHSLESFIVTDSTFEFFRYFSHISWIKADTDVWSTVSLPDTGGLTDSGQIFNTFVSASRTKLCATYCQHIVSGNNTATSYGNQ